MSDKTKKWHLTFSVPEVIKEKAIKTAEGATGIVSSNRQDLFRSAGRCLQDALKGQFWKRFKQEWEEFGEKGQIKPEYGHSQQCFSLFQEMLDSLDKDLGEIERLNVLKKILLVAASETVCDSDSPLPLQYMKICRTLESGEIFVLGGAYGLHKEQPTATGTVSTKGWRETIAKRSGLKHPELVESYETKLVGKNLIIKQRPDNNVVLGLHYRLTDLGYEVCVFLDKYEDLADSTKDSEKQD